MTEHPAREGRPGAGDAEHTTELPHEEPAGPAATPGSGFHPVNTGHLVMGLAFVGLALVWLLVERDVVDPADHGWVLGLPWLAAGAAGLVASVLSGARRGR